MCAPLPGWAPGGLLFFCCFSVPFFSSPAGPRIKAVSKFPGVFFFFFFSSSPTAFFYIYIFFKNSPHKNWRLGRCLCINGLPRLCLHEWGAPHRETTSLPPKPHSRAADTCFPCVAERVFSFYFAPLKIDGVPKALKKSRNLPSKVKKSFKIKKS